MEFKKFVIHIRYVEAEETKSVSSNPMTIGRSYSVDLPLIFSDVSRNHLKVYSENQEIFIEDLGSKNGTYLNGEKIEPNKLVAYREGDVVTLGRTQESLSFHAEYGAMTVTPPPPSPRLEVVAPPPRPSAQAESVLADMDALNARLMELKAEKESEERRLSELRSDIAELEMSWKSKTDELLREQEGIKVDLQKELLQMKDVFDSKKTELEKIEVELETARAGLKSIQPQEIELRQKISQLTQQKQKLETSIVELTDKEGRCAQEAEEFFIARQNDLIAEREELETLRERRILEVEMEMAQLKTQHYNSVGRALKVAGDVAESVAVDVAEESGGDLADNARPSRKDVFGTRAVASVFALACAVFALVFILKSGDKTSTADLASTESVLDVNWEGELRRFMIADLKLPEKTATAYLLREKKWMEESKRLRADGSALALEKLKKFELNHATEVSGLLGGRENYLRLLAHREKIINSSSSRKR